MDAIPTKQGCQLSSGRLQAFESVTKVCLAAPSRLPGFVSAGIQNQAQSESAAAKTKPTAMAANPEEMELDDVEEEAEDQVGAKQAEGDDAAVGMTHEVQLQQKTVPAAVFGGARESEDGANAQQQPTLGALDRFKKRKTQP